MDYSKWDNLSDSDSEEEEEFEERRPTTATVLTFRDRVGKHVTAAVDVFHAHHDQIRVRALHAFRHGREVVRISVEGIDHGIGFFRRIIGGKNDVQGTLFAQHFGGQDDSFDLGGRAG